MKNLRKIRIGANDTVHIRAAHNGRRAVCGASSGRGGVYTTVSLVDAGDPVTCKKCLAKVTAK